MHEVPQLCLFPVSRSHSSWKGFSEVYVKCWFSVRGCAPSCLASLTVSWALVTAWTFLLSWNTQTARFWTWGRTSSLWGWQSTGTGCPGRLWSLLLWRSSRTAWTRSCAACCRWPCFDRRVGLDDPQRSLPNPNILFILWWKNAGLLPDLSGFSPDEPLSCSGSAEEGRCRRLYARWHPWKTPPAWLKPLLGN